MNDDDLDASHPRAALVNNDDDGYALARPPRRVGPGCPLCGAEITPTKAETWPHHIVAGQKCGMSGRGTGHPTDWYFRTFHDRDSPEGFPESGHRTTTTLEFYGDAIGVANTLEIPSTFGMEGHVGAQVTTLITKADYPRLLDELGRMARDAGWLDEEGNVR